MICSSCFFVSNTDTGPSGRRGLKPCPEIFWSREIFTPKKKRMVAGVRAQQYIPINTYIILSILGLEDWEDCYFCSLLMFLRKGRWLVDIVHLLSFSIGSAAKGFCKAFFVDLLLTDSIGQTTCVQSAVSKNLVVVDSYKHPINAFSQSDITIEQFKSCLVNTMKNPQSCLCYCTFVL